MLLNWLRVLWISAILINLSGVIWFILGSTANFKRGIDLISTVILMFFVIPSIIIIVLSVTLLFKRWSALKGGIIGIFFMITCMCMFLLTPTMFKSVNTSGWLTESVQTDTLQTTEDGQYEYCIEIINLFQRNSNARLYVKDVSTAEVRRIHLELPIYEIHGIGVGKVNYWVELKPASQTDKYILHTTNEFPLAGLGFEIDVSKGEALKLE